jgi:SSS family solute:Na+ symporter
MRFAYGQPVDYVIVVIYFVGILVFGSLFGRTTRTTSDFFFSGRRFPWWLVAFSCVATVVGSYSFIKYSAVAFSYGLSSTMSYLNDWFLAPLFLLGWMPIIYFSRVTSIPEYFERRFDRPTRVMGVVFILLYMIGYIGINLYTMGVAMQVVMPRLDVFQWAVVIAVITAVYVTAGGQTAVIMTDLVQGILLLAAGVVVLVLGILYIGDHAGAGLSAPAAFWQGLPPAHRLPFSGFSSPDAFPMAGIFWQDLFGASMFFYFGNQGLIMRFLSVKSVREGRKAFIVVILAMMPLAAVAVSGAGWVGRSMRTFGLIPETTDPNAIFMAVTAAVTRPGVFGFVLAALTAALMSTVDTLINAVAAIAVNDIWKPLVAPGRSDRHYLGVARVSSVVFALAGLLLVPVFMQHESIYVAHGSFTAAISPPLIVVIILGILWKRFSPRAAFATLLGGGLVVGLSIYAPVMIGPLADLHGMGPGEGYSFMRALFGMIVCSAIAVVCTFVWPRRDARTIDGLWIGSLKIARRLFKGAEPNDESPGAKVRAVLAMTGEGEPQEEGAEPFVAMSRADAERMLAGDGDMIYLADRRWWLGGLVSLHARLKVADVPEGTARLDRRRAAQAGFRAQRGVVVEKIL